MKMTRSTNKTYNNLINNVFYVKGGTFGGNGRGTPFIPWLLVLLNLLSHLEELRAGGDIGWIDPVTWRGLPSMYFHFLTGSEGLNYPGLLLWLVLIVLFVVCLRTRRSDWDETYCLLLCNLWIPVTLVFVLSWRTSLFVDRYVFFASLSLPIVLAIKITECNKKVCRNFWIILFSVVFFFGIRNSYPSEKDEFNALMQDINIQYSLNDVVVVSDMFHYLSYLYYNKREHHVLLYTPKKPDGASGKPNAYGFGTFFYSQAARTYVEELDTLSQCNHRVWIVSSSDFIQDIKVIPTGWSIIGVVKRGGFSALLFATEKQPSTTKQECLTIPSSAATYNH